MTKTKSTTEILFAHSYLVEHDRRPLGYMHPLPPLRYAQVAAYIEQEASAIVSVWDSTFRISTDSFDVEVSRVRPQIVWLYTHPTTRKAACRMIAAGRRAGAVVVVGGPDAELNPSRYLKAGADAAIRGEEEGPTLAMVLALRAAHHRASPSLLRRIPGLSYLEEDGRLWQSEGEGISVAISELPRPHRMERPSRPTALGPVLGAGLPRFLRFLHQRGLRSALPKASARGGSGRDGPPRRDLPGGPPSLHRRGLFL